MAYLASQIIGAIVAVAAVLSLQLKNVKAILICQLVCNGLGAVSYVLLGGLAGFVLHIVATVQTILFFVIRSKNLKEPKWLSWIFVAAFLLCSFATFKSLVDVFSLIAAVACSLALCCKKPSHYRICMLINCGSWLLYDASVAAYTMILTHGAVVVSSIVGMIRLDRKKPAEHCGEKSAN